MEFKFTVDSEGNPIIKVRHFDKRSDLESKMFAVFIKKAKKNGLILSNPSGAGEEGDTDAHENYIIKCVRDEDEKVSN